MTKQAIRGIWTDKAGLISLGEGDDLQPGVYAIIGPIESHVAEPEFQDALNVVAIRRNRRHGFLNFGKFIALFRRYNARGRRYL